MEVLGLKGEFLDLTRMLNKAIMSQVMVNGHPTDKINVQRGVRQGCLFSMILFVLSSIPLINMIKADKIITGHITKYVRLVKVQSYADDTTITIMGQPRIIEHVYTIYEHVYRFMVITLKHPKLPSTKKRHRYSDLSWGWHSVRTEVKRSLKTCRTPLKLSRSSKMDIVSLSAWWVKY